MKWSSLEDIYYLLVNLQESEPILYSDKWLIREQPEKFKELFDLLLNIVFDAIVVGTKEKYREEWVSNLENLTKASVYLPKDLPMEVGEESGVVIAYTEDVYEHSKELSLLKVTTGTIVSPDLPTQHDWITQNTETVYNIYKALFNGKPMTKKYVAVGGNTPRHRCLETPIGTTVPDLLDKAGLEMDDLGRGEILLEGGPGWCSKVRESPYTFGVSKRTNAIIVIEKEKAEKIQRRKRGRENQPIKGKELERSRTREETY